MNIPEYIIALNDTDLDRARTKFLKQTNGSTFGCQFLTLTEARKNGVDIPYKPSPCGYVLLTPLAEAEHNQLIEKIQNHSYAIVTEQFKNGYTKEEVEAWWEEVAHDFKTIVEMLKKTK